MTQTKLNVPRLNAFKIDISPPDDLTDTTIKNIAAWLPLECYQYAMVLERGKKSGKLHAHCFLLTKRSWTTSAFGKHARKALTKILEHGSNPVPIQAVAFHVNAVYNDDYLQDYMQKDDDHVKRVWHIDEDSATRLEAYRKCPNKSRDPHHNASFRLICKEFALAHPGKRAHFDTMSRFIWTRMKEHRMKIETNPGKMVRLVRIAVALVNDSNDYDYDQRHPNEMNY